MANTPANIQSTAWETALAGYLASRDALTEMEMQRLKAEEDRDDAEELLLNTPAPNLAAVVTKLEAIWAENFRMVSDPIVDAQRLMIADIKRFAAVSI